jgi:LasA protease
MIIGAWFILAFTAFACTRSATGSQSWRPQTANTATALPAAAVPEIGRTPYTPPTRQPGVPIPTPTPDQARVMPTLRVSSDTYVIKPNDTLGQIAKLYGVPLATLVEINNIANPDLVEPGQVLEIPPGDPRPPGPAFKIIPDSELVYGPASAYFDLPGFIQIKKGYINNYQEELDGEIYSGADVVQRVAQEYSVNPRLLLAVLEYRSGWVTSINPPENSRDYPMLYFDQRRKGLYRQLAWSANQLNRGHYLWRANAVPSWVLADGVIIPAAPTLNAGTAGVQNFFSLLLTESEWTTAVTEDGLFSTYYDLFGYPFDYAVEPITPPGLTQPVLQLPFEPGKIWSFTGGPHGGWADGSGWAAIDFAPPGEALGCVQSDAWVVASADGLILRAHNGAVVQDLDGDGMEQTGWTIFYMHIESRDRVKPGTFLKAGERIGHPSCEGGFSTGTHLHIARRFNGEWIPSDGPLPFNLDGWISRGDGYEYNGYLVKNGVTIEAMQGRKPENEISR